MLPSPVLEWAVWANLDRYRSLELILLKGHLLIEITLIISLEKHVDLSSTRIRDMSFHRKIKELERYSINGSSLGVALPYAKELNAIRNKLAHEPFAKQIDSEIGEWAEKVLVAFPSSKYQKYTARTKTTQALALLAKVLYESTCIDTVLTK